MKIRTLVVVLVALLVLASFSVFTVNETQRNCVILLQLGKIKRANYKPGLYFKIPLIENVLKFDARIQNLDSAPQLVLTSEKKNVKVDSYVKWRIQNVVQYYKATGGDMTRANDRLADFIQKRLKDEFGKRTLNEVVSGERAKIMDILTAEAKTQAASLGIDIVDVRIKRVDLPEDVSASVYKRMAAERKQVAKQFRSRGEEAARIIRARADREREVTLAEAERDAQRIRGEGDAAASDIYAKAYGQDPDFFELYRSLSAYRATLNNPSDILLLKPDSEFFKYFKGVPGKQ